MNRSDLIEIFQQQKNNGKKIKEKDQKLKNKKHNKQKEQNKKEEKNKLKKFDSIKMNNY